LLTDLTIYTILYLYRFNVILSTMPFD